MHYPTNLMIYIKSKELLNHKFSIGNILWITEQFLLLVFITVVDNLRSRQLESLVLTTIDKHFIVPQYYKPFYKVSDFSFFFLSGFFIW